MKSPKKPKGMPKKPAKPKEFTYPELHTIQAHISQKQWATYKKTKGIQPPYLMGLGGKSKKFLFSVTGFGLKVKLTCLALQSLKIPHEVLKKGSTKNVALKAIALGGSWRDQGTPKSKILEVASAFSSEDQTEEWSPIFLACFSEMSRTGNLIKTPYGWITNSTIFPQEWASLSNFRAQNRLIATLQAKRKEMEELAKSCDSHWGFEDSFYRYYHQSFKVYYLQKTTEKIVALLETIQRESQLKDLNPWFMEIIKEGTGKEFHRSHNQEWQKHTRPIVEAYFHAREMLRMAQKYGRELKEATCSLPSGWATLLYLYRMR